MVSSMKYMMIIFSLMYQTLTVYCIPVPIAANDAPKLQGKMLSSGNVMPYPAYQNFPTVGGFPGEYPPMYAPRVGPHYADVHAYGGNGYVPNYLQQYDMMYSRNRRTYM